MGSGEARRRGPEAGAQGDSAAGASERLDERRKRATDGCSIGVVMGMNSRIWGYRLASLVEQNFDAALEDGGKT